jgi:hypothetical protein
VHYQHFDVAFGFDQNTRPLLPLHRRREYNMLYTRHGKIIITTECCYQRKTGLIARGRNGSAHFSPAATTKIWIYADKGNFSYGQEGKNKSKVLQLMTQIMPDFFADSDSSVCPKYRNQAANTNLACL